MDQAKRNKLEAAGWTVAGAEQFLSTDGYTTQDAINNLLRVIGLGEAELDDCLRCKDALGTRMWCGRLNHLRECLDIIRNPKSKLLRDTEEYMEALQEPCKQQATQQDKLEAALRYIMYNLDMHAALDECGEADDLRNVLEQLQRLPHPKSPPMSGDEFAQRTVDKFKEPGAFQKAKDLEL